MPRNRKMTPTTPEAPRVRGTVDIWPIQRALEPQLLKELAAGHHDRILDDLEHAERTQHARPAVLLAIGQRRRR